MCSSDLLAMAWPTVLAGRLVDRFGKGVRTAPRDALIADSSDPERRGRAYGLHRAMDTLGATLGVVMGAAASRVHERDALNYVAGYVAVNDVTVPHASVLRPPMKQKCRDSFCPIGTMTDSHCVPNPDDLEIRAFVNGELKATHSTRNLVRSVSRLMAEVTEFMTLEAGEILLVGTPENLPRARADRKSTRLNSSHT